MKAIGVFPGTKEIRVVEHPEPELQRATDVKLRMLDVGVCGTDKEICRFDYGTPPRGSEYLILGHESLGEVIETGAEVKSLKKGDLVITMVRRPCNHEDCRACRCDQQDFCYTGDFKERGIKGLHGFMAEYVVDDEKYMHHVPGELRDFGVLVEPLTIAEKALIQLWDIQERLPWECRHTHHKKFTDNKDRGICHRAVVLGAGPVGILGAMAMVNAGFQTTVYSRSPAPNPKADIIKSIGASYVSSEEVSASDLARRVGNIDVVYEATGVAKLSFDVMEYTGVNSVFIFTGVPGRKHQMELNTSALMRNLVLKNQVVLGTVNAGADAFMASIRDLKIFHERWPDAVQNLITHRYLMEECKEPLLGRGKGIKNVIAVTNQSEPL